MSQELTINADQDRFTDQQQAALRQLGVEDATDADLAIFLHQAKRTGLDPFARQIYMISRRQKDRDGKWITKQTIQTGIDGFRLIARRAADARGESFSMDDTLWADMDGHWHDLWIWDTPPAAAKTTVHLGDAHFSAVAATREYMPTRQDRTTGELVPTGQWRSMPAVMIAKCSEALALRKAFPMDLSGLYTADEMAQAQVEERATPVPAVALPAPVPVVTPERVAAASSEAELKAMWRSTQDPHARAAIQQRVAELRAQVTPLPDTDTDPETAA